jgi:hypothetical protein
MGFIKSIFLGLISILILILISISLFFASAYNSLEYDNLKESTNQVLFSHQNELIDSLEEGRFELENLCKEHDFIETSTLFIPCSTIISGKQETDEFISSQANFSKNSNLEITELEYNYFFDYCTPQETVKVNLQNESELELSCYDLLDSEKNLEDFAFEPIFDSIYNSKYSCTFYKCLKQNPLSLFSFQSYSYMKSKFYFVNLIILILSLVIIFFSEKKSYSLVYLGGIFLLGTFLFKFFKNSVLSLIENALKKISFLIDSSQISQITQVVFQQANFVIKMYYFFGILLIVAGIGFYIYNIFFGSKTWTKSEIKEMIKAKD